MTIQEWVLLAILFVLLLISYPLGYFLAQRPYNKLWEQQQFMNLLEREMRKTMSAKELLCKRVKFKGEWLEVQYAEIHFDGSIVYVTSKGKVPKDIAEEVSNKEEKK